MITIKKRTHRTAMAPNTSSGLVTANAVLRIFDKKKMAVRDDGRCWIYVVMVAMGKYVAKPKRGCRVCDPSPEESVIANEMCNAISHEFPEITKEPDYAGERSKDDFFGAYGGTEQWQVLAPLYNLLIILWDPRSNGLMNDSSATFFCVYPNGRMFKKTADEILKAVLDVGGNTTVVHAAWSNTIEAHFDVYA